MSIFYGTGTHRLIYKAQNFSTGLTVTGYIWNPSLTKSALQTFTEVSDGLYYLDYNFAVAGVHFGKFYEGGVETTEGVFRVDTDITTIMAKTDNLPSGIAKNVALSAFTCYMVLSSDHVSSATGKTIVGTLSKDGGIFVALTNSITEISNGMYKVDITQAEMNADVITLKFTETDCDQRIVVIYTT